jgi:hypothetical protein
VASSPTSDQAPHIFELDPRVREQLRVRARRPGEHAGFDRREEPFASLLETLFQASERVRRGQRRSNELPHGGGMAREVSQLG